MQPCPVPRQTTMLGWSERPGSCSGSGLRRTWSGLRSVAKGAPFAVRRDDLPTHLYAAAGGGFPIRVTGVGVVGAVTVSGLAQEDDHALVVEALRTFLDELSGSAKQRSPPSRPDRQGQADASGQRDRRVSASGTMAAAWAQVKNVRRSATTSVGRSSIA